MAKYSEYEFRTQPWFNASWFAPDSTDRFNQFIPMKSEAGNRVGNTRTLFAVSNAGGRALAALQSVATMDYLFRVQNVAVVHHSFCGATAFTPETLIGEFHDHHHADIAGLFDHDSLAIGHFEDSIRHDVKLLRASPAVPKNVKLYGFFYEINSGTLTEVVRDFPPAAA